MGVLFSKEKNDSKNFEQVLSRLDADIQKAESHLTQLKIKQRKTSFMWIIYSLVIWTVCVLYLFYQCVDNKQENSTQDVLLAALPVIGLPVVIYHVRRLLVWWYESRQKKEELHLAQLRKEQKDKLEDLKKKTSYYTTQSLLEKYDEAQKKKKEELARQQQQQQQQQRKPVSMPMRPQPPLLPQQQQQQQQMQRMQQPILPPPRTEPQWYDRIVDALVGDVGPETKYALICNHCFAHNGLVMKEEFDTIQYVCPHCKQFNPSRQSKMIPQQEKKEAVEEEKKDVIEKQDSIEEESDEKVLEKIKAEYLQDNDPPTIASRVRQRHTTTNKD
ncbi:uncharacterized protein B0P05DRAFT_585850 [Gilbertella persicaria]|uniref:uncharacterized protein n=1 Tax=Gilbertella persicaria TaxID=101096 RepID=UPI00221EAE34|nr:uncharacterized protein B0P05DRAFT_585850 [Gilbertella persicaria]KAI8084086.1 hypothetical protein B0P05DRAFT_585850 [Gilbertella persicaria]